MEKKYKEPKLNKAGAKAVLAALGAANAAIENRHKKPTTKAPKKK